MLFSVIIPTYNRAGLLKLALESVFAQQFTDYEVIVVDDGSDDQSADVLMSFGDRVLVLRQDNRGQGHARNLGLRYATGAYVAFLDSDDMWFPWTLRTFAELIVKYKHPAVLSARLVEFTDEAELRDVAWAEPHAAMFPDYYSSHTARYFVGAGMSVLDRRLLTCEGGFTVARINGEDHDLILRMGTASGFVQVLQPVTVAWRRHKGSATTDTRRSLAGGRYLIEQELGQRYPGGPARTTQRRSIIGQRVRPISLECLRVGLRQEAWELYWKTFGWHIDLGRWKYLIGFPFKAILSKW